MVNGFVFQLLMYWAIRFAFSLTLNLSAADHSRKAAKRTPQKCSGGNTGANRCTGGWLG
jgi:hypothetical protein